MPTIFLIEDSLCLQKIITSLLSINSYEVEAFDSGPPALERLKSVTPNLILCDIVLPGMDGYEIFRRTREREQESGMEIPFIFLSALAERDQVRMGMNLGVDDYITKPFTGESLLSAVRVRLERSGIRREQAKLEQLRHSENLIRSLPHEVRTPLNGIVGGISLLRDLAGKDNEELQELVEIIEESATRLETTLLRYLLFLDLQTDRAFRKESTPCRDVAMEVTAIARAHAIMAGREADLVLQTHQAQVACGECLEHVTSELVSNAFKFSMPGTKVEVTMSSSGGRLRVTCRDHGRGMSEQEISQIGPFVQFQRKKYQQQGLGLGLAICMAVTRCEGCGVNLTPAQDGGLIAELTLPENIEIK